MDGNVDLQLDDLEEELFFDSEAVLEAMSPPAAPQPDPEPAPAAAKPKRKARRAEPAEDLLAADPLPLSIPATPALPVLPELDALEVAEAPGPAAAAPLPRMVLVALVLAAIASLFSAIGLLVAARTVSAAGIARDEAASRAESLGRLDHALDEVEKLAAAQKAALARGATGGPLTADELHRELDALRQSYSRTQAPGTQALASFVRQGQAELSGRMDTLEERIDAISQRATQAARR